MNVVRTAVLLALAADPFGAAVVFASAVGHDDDPRARRRAAGVAGLAVAGLLLAGAWSGATLLDALSVSPESAALAAGIVLAIPALRLLWRGSQLDLLEDGDVVEPGERSGEVEGAGNNCGRMSAWRVALVPVAVPLAAGPGPFLAVVAWSELRGRGASAGAAVVVGAAVALLLATLPPRAASNRLAALGARLAGAAMLLVAVDLAADGVLAT